MHGFCQNVNVSVILFLHQENKVAESELPCVAKVRPSFWIQNLYLYFPTYKVGFPCALPWHHQGMEEGALLTLCVPRTFARVHSKFVTCTLCDQKICVLQEEPLAPSSGLRGIGERRVRTIEWFPPPPAHAC